VDARGAGRLGWGKGVASGGAARNTPKPSHHSAVHTLPTLPLTPPLPSPYCHSLAASQPYRITSPPHHSLSIAPHAFTFSLYSQNAHGPLTCLFDSIPGGIIDLLTRHSHREDTVCQARLHFVQQRYAYLLFAAPGLSTGRIANVLGLREWYGCVRRVRLPLNVVICTRRKKRRGDLPTFHLGEGTLPSYARRE